MRRVAQTPATAASAPGTWPDEIVSLSICGDKFVTVALEPKRSLAWYDGPSLRRRMQDRPFESSTRVGPTRVGQVLVESAP